MLAVGDVVVTVKRDFEVLTGNKKSSLGVSDCVAVLFAVRHISD